MKINWLFGLALSLSMSLSTQEALSQVQDSYLILGVDSPSEAAPHLHHTGNCKGLLATVEGKVTLHTRCENPEDMQNAMLDYVKRGIVTFQELVRQGGVIVPRSRRNKQVSVLLIIPHADEEKVRESTSKLVNCKNKIFVAGGVTNVHLTCSTPTYMQDTLMKFVEKGVLTFDALLKRAVWL